ncbi:MAG: HD domain-containing protein [Butyrivibrio sp.]|uniref:3'-5' exoribonuclease YhaM family protein n=1 Tax=Butyrivibrio sp. TaxID=28121 RepID=UPI001B1BA598|nr:HD domain-containing protein [Butyrivibrio sp.]MBO6240704.1 HD domain-containing protein [Butyrivibrio sp.]
MKFIKDLTPGDRVADIYMCKHKLSATTKNGKEYYSVTLQDKTGTIDAKIWEPNSDGIDEFDDTDCIDVFGEVTSFNGALQINVKRARKCHEGEYDPSLYLPVSSKDIDVMYKELLGIIGTIENPYLKKLLEEFFVHDEAFITAFRKSSAAKTVHHSFIGGLLEHTLSVTKLCNFYCTSYPALNRDLLLTAAICHDIGKTKELSLYPVNDYTDEGQFLGHIVMGAEMVGDRIREINGFPLILKQELIHCILAHHGELEYGSPKKPAIIEAVALNLADNTDAKMETFTEILGNITTPGWQGFNKFFESNIYSTKME